MRADDRGGVALVEKSVALRVDAARRRGVEHDRPADRRLRPQHDAIAAGRDDRGGEAQLGVALADADDARGNPARPVVYREPGAVADRLELGERHLEPVRARERVGRDEGVTPADIAPLHARQVDGHALAGLRSTDRRVVHVHRPDAHVATGGLQSKSVPLGDRARPQRPRDDRPDPFQREDAVDEQAGGEVGASLLGRRRDFLERGTQLVEALAGHAADRDDVRAGDELARFLERELERLGVDGVGFRDRDDSALDSEETQDREVLVRLRPRAFRRVDHEQEEVDAGRPRHHRAHEPLVAGDVDERQRATAGQLERRIAEVDRDPARLLLGEPVGVLARERPDERRLAVVDVTGGSDGQRHDGGRGRRPRPVTRPLSAHAPRAQRGRPRRSRRP